MHLRSKAFHSLTKSILCAAGLMSCAPVGSVMKALVATGIFVAVPSYVSADVTRTSEENEKKRKKKNNSPVVPESHDVSARFMAGQSVEIELMGAVSSIRAVNFILRSQPSHGTLSNLRPHPKDNHKSLITYTHNGGDAPLDDSFTYACRVEDGPVSAPARVSLVGKHHKPILEVKAAPLFNRVFVGEATSAVVIVRNLGAAAYSNPLAWEAPWSGPPVLKVEPGKTVELIVRFQPENAATFRSRMELQPGVANSTLHLQAECVRALTASPGEMAFQWDPKTGERTAVLTIANARIERVRATLKLPARVKGPTDLDLEPQSRTEVLLRLPATDVGAFEGAFTVTAGDDVEHISATAAPKPGALKILASKEVGLQPTRQDEETRTTIAMTNEGGQPLVMNPEIWQPFFIDGGNLPVRIEPGQQHSLVVGMKASRVGQYTGRLTLNVGAQATTLELKAFVNAKATPTKAPEGADGAPVLAGNKAGRGSAKKDVLDDGGLPKYSPTQAAFLAMLATQGAPIPKKLINPYLDSVSEVELVERTSSSLTLSWAAPTVPPHSWNVEMPARVQNNKLGASVKVWIPIQESTLLESDGDKVVMRVDGLAPGVRHEFRILGVDRDGKFSKPSPIFSVETAEPWALSPWVWRGLVSGALLLAIYVLYRVRRGDFDVEETAPPANTASSGSLIRI